MQLEKQIEKLDQLLISMANITLDNINEAFKININTDKQYLINDDIIDHYERLIEELCLDILIKERPYASDLRRVLGIMKLIVDLERIGDHASDIQKYNLKIDKKENYQIETINQASKKAIEMLEKTIKSFITMDLELAQKIILEDKEVNNLFDKTIEILVKMNDDKEISSVDFTNHVFVIKYIEKIADHATNIAEWIIYMINGMHKNN